MLFFPDSMMGLSLDRECARKIRVEYEQDGTRQPCPLKWLDSFAMRSFTNDAVFDDTLPVVDGSMEIGARVPLDRLHAALEDWFRKKSYLPKEGKLIVSNAEPSPVMKPE